MAGVQLMLILLAIVMALLGLWQMVNPRGNWRATEGWKYRDPDANEPSETSYGLRSIGGFFTIVMAAVLAGLGMQAGGLGASESGSSADATYSDPCDSYAWYCHSDDSSPAPRPTALGQTVDPFSSAAASPVAGGEPVTLFTPVVEGEVQRDQSDSSKQIGVKPVYYPWTASDQPAAFASAAVIDSKVALATLDPAQATTQGAGAGVLGERTYIVVQLSRPACAITSASASLSNDQTYISISVYGIPDLSRCGQPTEGAYVAIPLSDELVQAARNYQAPVYHPLAAPSPTPGSYGRTPDPASGNAWSSGYLSGDYKPTIFESSDRGEFTETWKDPVTDAEIEPHRLVPWVAPGSS